MYHADTPTRTINAYDIRRRPPERRRTARVRALRRRDRPARRRRGRQRGLLLDRVLSRRQASCASRPRARCSPSIALPAMCPTMCAFGGPDLQDALRDERAAAARRRRARAAAAIGRDLRDARRRARDCPSRRSPADRATPPCTSIRPPSCGSTRRKSLGASASGASFATSTGDILEVSCFGPGVFRLRVGPEHAARLRPRAGHARKACTVAHEQRRPLHVHGGRCRRSRSPERRCASGCCIAASRCWPRSPTSISAAGRGCRRSAACARAASGSPRSRSRRASRSTGSARNSARSTSAASSSIRRSSTRSASTPARRTRTCRSRGARAPATAPGACSSTRPGMVTHGVGHPDWSHRSYAVLVDDEALDLFLFAADTPAGDPRPLHAAHRPRAGGAAVEPRPVGVARVLQDARGSGDGRRDAARAQDPLRRADARRPRRVGRRDALRFRVGRDALSRPATRRSRRSRRTTCASASGNTRTSRSTRRCSRSSRRAATC